MRAVLNTKSGLQKFILTRKYKKFAKGVYQHAKVAFAYDLSYLIPYIISLTVCIRQGP